MKQALLATVLLFVPMLATADETACVAGKMKAASGYSRRGFTCGSDAACVLDAATRLEAKLVRVDLKNVCSNSTANAFSRSVVDLIDDNFSPVFGEGDCADAQRKATGTRTRGILRAYAGDARRPDAEKLSEALGKAEEKFATAFAASLAIGGCTATDASEVADRDTQLVIEPILNAMHASCGNDLRETGEQCDGSDVELCAACLPDCSCPTCGNDVAEAGETCDGADSSACPGVCEEDCGCPGPVVCGDGDVDAPESCDGAHLGSCTTLAEPGCTNGCQCCSNAGCSALYDCCSGLTCTNPQPVPGPLVFLGTCGP